MCPPDSDWKRDDSTGVVEDQCDGEDEPREVLVAGEEASTTNQETETNFKTDSDWIITRYDI